MTDTELRNLNASIAAAMGWTNVTVEVVSGRGWSHDTTVGTSLGVEAVIPHYSESLDALTPVMDEIRRRGLMDAWTDEINRVMCGGLRPWVSLFDLINAPADVRAKAALAVLSKTTERMATTEENKEPA